MSDGSRFWKERSRVDGSMNLQILSVRLKDTLTTKQGNQQPARGKEISCSGVVEVINPNKTTVVNVKIF